LINIFFYANFNTINRMCAPSTDADYLYLKIQKKSKEKVRQPKEATMPIKVLIKRRFKDGYVNEINKVINRDSFWGYGPGRVHNR
jgi:hypothetical protein